MSAATMAAGEYSASRIAAGVNHTPTVAVRRRVRTVWTVIGSAHKKCMPANMPAQQNQASNESPNTHPIVIGRGYRDSSTAQTTQPDRKSTRLNSSHLG